MNKLGLSEFKIPRKRLKAIKSQGQCAREMIAFIAAMQANDFVARRCLPERISLARCMKKAGTKGDHNPYLTINYHIMRQARAFGIGKK